MAHTLATMQFQQEPQKPISPPHPHGMRSPLSNHMVGSPPPQQSLPLDHGVAMHSPCRNHSAGDVLPMGSDWDNQQQQQQKRSHSHDNPAMYSMQAQSPEPRAAVPTVN
jgi:hypothetical protein